MHRTPKEISVRVVSGRSAERVDGLLLALEQQVGASERAMRRDLCDMPCVLLVAAQTRCCMLHVPQWASCDQSTSNRFGCEYVTLCSDHEARFAPPQMLGLAASKTANEEGVRNNLFESASPMKDSGPAASPARSSMQEKCQPRRRDLAPR